MNPLLTSIKRAFSQPAFLVAIVVLGICAATLNTTAAMLRLKFLKQPVPLRLTLKQGIPQKLGHWISVSADTAIDPEVQQVLGTSEYIFRDYVDNQKVSPAEIAEMKAAPPEKRQAMLAKIQSAKPSAVIRVAMTYYTGIVDTVAHVPERCYVADGFEVKQYEVIKANLGNYPDGTPRDVEFRFLNFEDQTSMGQQTQRVARNVGYVFHCNGSYESSSYKVRQRLQNLFEPYGYYAKVELLTAAPFNPLSQRGASDANDHDESVAAMEGILCDALPELEKCMADWKALHQKK